jgi:hypothetical protein
MCDVVARALHVRHENVTRAKCEINVDKREALPTRWRVEVKGLSARLS